MMNIICIAKESCRVICTMTLFCFLLTACQSTRSTSPITTTQAMNDTSAIVKCGFEQARLRDFTLQLWQHVSQEEQKNVFLSPLSVAMAMRTVADGAQGETLDELNKVITLIEPEQSDHLHIANALFAKPSSPCKPIISHNADNEAWKSTTNPSRRQRSISGQATKQMVKSTKY